MNYYTAENEGGKLRVEPSYEELVLGSRPNSLNFIYINKYIYTNIYRLLVTNETKT